jgi:hypothetical protein
MNSPSPRRLSSLRGHNVVAGMLAPSFRGDGEQRQLPQQG